MPIVRIHCLKVETGNRPTPASPDAMNLFIRVIDYLNVETGNRTTLATRDASKMPPE